MFVNYEKHIHDLENRIENLEELLAKNQNHLDNLYDICTKMICNCQNKNEFFTNDEAIKKLDTIRQQYLKDIGSTNQYIVKCEMIIDRTKDPRICNKADILKNLIVGRDIERIKQFNFHK